MVVLSSSTRPLPATVVRTTRFASRHFTSTLPRSMIALQRPGTALTFPNAFHDEIDNADGHVCFFAVRRCARGNRCVSCARLAQSSAACETTTTAVCGPYCGLGRYVFGETLSLPLLAGRSRAAVFYKLPRETSTVAAAATC